MTSAQPLPPLTQIPAYLQTIADYEAQASKHLTPTTWHYLQGGAMDERSLQQNLDQFQQLQLLPRMLRDLSQGHTRCELFGQEFPHPIFLAPVGHQQLFHPQGELATALAAEAVGSNLVLSHLSTTDLRELAPTTSLKWFQLYWQGNREQSLALVQLAEQQQFKAIVVTVDSPHSGVRDRERRAGFQVPAHLPHPHLSSFTSPILRPEQHPLFDGLMQQAPTWEDIAWLVQQTSLPVLLKGIVHPEDAQLALQYGVQGLVISNHGGRVLDDCISPLTALQMIRAQLPANFPLLLDGGIRRGSDIFKALALGASAVLIGRPYIYGLAVAGALGVAHVIKILREELEVTMALMGTARLNEINSRYIFHKNQIQ